MRHGMSAFVLDDLLSALEGSPLEHLILQGIRDGSPELIGRIAHLFPNLISLTLVYRDSERQMEDRYTAWPSPTWEYAQQLRHFKCLKHFGWNLATDVVYSPSTMTFLEDGLPLASFPMPEDQYFESSREVARLLAVYRPSLESVAFTGRGVPSELFVITQLDGEGRVIVEEPGNEWGISYAEYNPIEWTGWPSLPRQN